MALRKLLTLCASAIILSALVLTIKTNPIPQVSQAQEKKNTDKKANQKKKAIAQVKRDESATTLSAAFKQAAENGGAEVLSEGDSYDDFVSIAQTSDDTLYAAYASYYDGHDQIRLHRKLSNGTWSTRSYVPLAQARADVWMPQLAVDAEDKVWVIWSEQTGQSQGKTGNFDLYARPLIGERWGPLVRLTENAKPDINHHVILDAQRRIHIVWQAHPENNGDIQYCYYDGKAWSKPLAITSDEASDWYPHVAVDAKGVVWIAFDSYRNGDYDVFLVKVENGVPGKLIPIAASPYYEAHASVACTSDGKVWLAWEQGGHNWGKDQGHWLNNTIRDLGSTLGGIRSVKVAAYQDGKLLGAPDVALSLPQTDKQKTSAQAELAVGADGRLWLRFRRLLLSTADGRGRSRKGWAEFITSLTAAGWTAAQELPASAGRISVFSRLCPGRDGQLYVAYSADGRGPDNFHRPIQDMALVATLEKPVVATGIPQLTEYVQPELPPNIPPWDAPREAARVKAIREFRTDIHGEPHRIVRGDLHRHTELSWDIGPGADGSFLDYYRYMIDVAAMDFGGLSDHQGGGHYKYWWWLTEKSCDLYYLAPRYVPLYGYERSVTFPNGHRNVFHAYRGVPVFPFQIAPKSTGVFPGVSASGVVENDTKLLYEYLHRTGGLCISHTSATSSMGTDWRDNDPQIEPVVEIYQGDRNSYETLGGPRVHPEDKPPASAPGGFQKAGLVWNAYQKGYRLGTITSSDHISTHISYAAVFTPVNDRQAILDSIRKRQTYGSTDNIIVTCTANGQFMGQEFESAQLPSLKLRVQGTSKIVKVDLIRNLEYIYSSTPDKEHVEIDFVDMKPVSGMNQYYFRLEQDDGEVAWCSPIWLQYSK